MTFTDGRRQLIDNLILKGYCGDGADRDLADRSGWWVLRLSLE
jgi:hypothetical protein